MHVTNVTNTHRWHKATSMAAYSQAVVDFALHAWQATMCRHSDNHKVQHTSDDHTLLWHNAHGMAT
jgi:hypothetical protein